MLDETIEIPGGSTHDRAVAAAGALAELSAKTVEYISGSLHCELVTRQTDLPGVIERGVTDHGLAVVNAGGLHFEFYPSGARAHGEASLIIRVHDIMRR